MSKHWREWHTSELTDEECRKALMPHTFWQRVDFWLFKHIPLLHTPLWGAVCWFYPYDFEAHQRHWRWDNSLNKGGER